jgi:hypothetical protein
MVNAQSAGDDIDAVARGKLFNSRDKSGNTLPLSMKSLLPVTAAI